MTPDREPPMYERRQATRMRAPPDQDRITLRAGGRDLIARLRDESANGLAVTCTEAIKVREGDEVKIRTAAGWNAAQVMWVSSTAEGTAVGLSRGRELTQERDIPESPGLSRWILVVAVGAGLLAFPLVSIFWPKSNPKQPATVESHAP